MTTQNTPSSPRISTISDEMIQKLTPSAFFVLSHLAYLGHSTPLELVTEFQAKIPKSVMQKISSALSDIVGSENLPNAIKTSEWNAIPTLLGQLQQGFITIDNDNIHIPSPNRKRIIEYINKNNADITAITNLLTEILDKGFQVTAKNKYLDSIIALLGHGFKGEKFANLHYKLGLYYTQVEANDELALSYHLKSLEMRKDLGHLPRSIVAESYMKTGHAYKKLGKFEQALECYGHALAIYKAFESQDQALALSAIGSAYKEQNKNTEALQNYLAALKIYNNLDRKYSFNSLENIFSEIISYYEKFNIQYLQELIATLESIATIHEALSENSEAALHLEKAARIKQILDWAVVHQNQMAVEDLMEFPDDRMELSPVPDAEEESENTASFYDFVVFDTFVAFGILKGDTLIFSPASHHPGLDPDDHGGYHGGGSNDESSNYNFPYIVGRHELENATKPTAIEMK